MKTIFFTTCFILGISLLTSCTKDDNEISSPEDPYKALFFGDFAMVAYGDTGSQDAVKKLKEEQVITTSVVMDPNQNESQYYKALQNAKEGAIMYFLVDCSAYGNAMPQEAYDNLKELWQTWREAVTDSNVKRITPLWLVNIVNDKQGQDIFGVSMGPGWYLMSTDLNMPKFYLGETLSDIDFNEYIPQYTSSRELQSMSKSRSSDATIIKLQSLKKLVKLQYYYYDWDSPFFKHQMGLLNSKPYSYQFSPNCLHKGMPNASTLEEMKKNGGILINTTFVIEVMYVPGTVSEKVVKVTAQNGYTNFIVVEKYNGGNPMFLGPYLGCINDLMRAYEVGIGIESKGGTICSNQYFPDNTLDNYEYSDLVNFDIDLEAKAKGENLTDNKTYQFTVNSSEFIEYALKDMSIIFKNEEQSVNDDKKYVSWTVKPKIWHGKEAFYKWESDHIDWLNIKQFSSNLAKTNTFLSDQWHEGINKGIGFSHRNLTSQPESKQIALFRIKDSHEDIILHLDADIEFQHTLFLYMNRIFSAINTSYATEKNHVVDGVLATKIKISDYNSNLGKSVKISFGDPKVFPSFTEIK